MTSFLILFFDFFPFDSLGCVPENPCPDIRGVQFTECPVCRGTTAAVATSSSQIVVLLLIANYQVITRSWWNLCDSFAIISDIR